MFQGPFEFSIVKKARDKQLVEINIINIRDFGIGRQKIVDDTPYGGGIGMVMRVDVLHNAIEYAKSSVILSRRRRISEPRGELVEPIVSDDKKKTKVVLLSASGKTFNQRKAQEFSACDHLILVCGHYEGVDARIKKYIDEEISIGDFVTTGGEIPAMLITDSVTRLVPGVLKAGATNSESFSIKDARGQLYLEYPHYTRPAVFENMSVPDILLSGNHKKIQEWRMQQALEKTKKSRPDLLKK